MSKKFPTDARPTKGSIVGGLWKYAVVYISDDRSGTFGKPGWSVGVLSKYKTLQQAREAADSDYANMVEYRTSRGQPKPQREYYVAEWTMNADGEMVLVLIDEPEYDT